MAQTSFFADTLTLGVSTADGTNLSVGVIEGVEIVAEFENKELYGMESILREDVVRTKLRVPITFKTYKFHPELYGYIMGTRNAGKDLEGGTSASNTQATITDSNTVQLFEARGTVTGKNGDTFRVLVEGMYFENIPIPMPSGEFIGPEFTAIGRQLTIQYVTT